MSAPVHFISNGAKREGLSLESRRAEALECFSSKKASRSNSRARRACNSSRAAWSARSTSRWPQFNNKFRTRTRLLTFKVARMDALTVFGLFAVSAMLVCYALESRSHWFVLLFAVSCALGSAYGFLQGAWPFGLVEAIWSAVALRRWLVVRKS